MGMSSGAGDKKAVQSEINVTPLIDVLLVTGSSDGRSVESPSAGGSVRAPLSKTSMMEAAS